MSALDELFDDYPARLSVEQVAELLGVEERTVYGWLRQGQMPGYRLRATWLILRDEVKAWVLDGSNTKGGVAKGSARGRVRDANPDGSEEAPS